MKQRTKTDMIILHCSATKEGKKFTAKDIKKWHKEQGWEDIGYHYVIDIDGMVELGRDERMVGAHCTNKNSNSIGICYIGGLDSKGNAKDTRTGEQKHSMYALVSVLLSKYNLTINNVYGHNAFATKDCPCFKTEDFRQEYKQWKRSIEEGNKKSFEIVCPHCGKTFNL